MALDSERNQRGDQCISADSATLRAWIVQADEEGVIAREALRFIAGQ